MLVPAGTTFWRRTSESRFRRSVGRPLNGPLSASLAGSIVNAALLLRFRLSQNRDRFRQPTPAAQPGWLDSDRTQAATGSARVPGGRVVMSDKSGRRAPGGTLRFAAGFAAVLV